MAKNSTKGKGKGGLGQISLRKKKDLLYAKYCNRKYNHQLKNASNS